MKQIILFLIIASLAMTVNAQDVYSVGYYNVSNGPMRHFTKTARGFTLHIIPIRPQKRQE